MGLGCDTVLIATSVALLLGLVRLIATMSALVARLLVVMCWRQADDLLPTPGWCAPGEVSEEEFTARLQRLSYWPACLREAA